MSELALQSLIGYKPSSTDDGYVFHPKPRAVKKRGDKLVVTIGDMPLPHGIPHPPTGLTVLYGFRDALEELQRQYAVIQSQKMNIVKIDFKLEVGRIVTGTTGRDDIKDTKFLNLKRLSIDLQQMILDGVNELVAKENKKAVFFEKITEAGVRPDLICAVIHAEKIFRHVNSVVYVVPEPLPDGKKRLRQVATIFSSDVSEMAVRGDHPFEVELPKL